MLLLSRDCSKSMSSWLGWYDGSVFWMTYSSSLGTLEAVRSSLLVRSLPMSVVVPPLLRALCKLELRDAFLESRSSCGSGGDWSSSSHWWYWMLQVAVGDDWQGHAHDSVISWLLAQHPPSARWLAHLTLGYHQLFELFWCMSFAPSQLLLSTRFLAVLTFVGTIVLGNHWQITQTNAVSVTSFHMHLTAVHNK